MVFDGGLYVGAPLLCGSSVAAENDFSTLCKSTQRSMATGNSLLLQDVALASTSITTKNLVLDGHNWKKNKNIYAVPVEGAIRFADDFGSHHLLAHGGKPLRWISVICKR